MSEYIDTLLKKMDNSPGFAGLGGAVQTISRLVDDDGSNSEIAATILRDPVLTARLLHVANSSRYARGGDVSTVGQVLSILGLNTVKSVALSLALLNAASNKPQSNQLYAEIVTAFFSGSLAAEITRNNGAAYSVQEAQICGLMQNLGRMMSLFYLYEDIERSRKLQIDRNISENEAVMQILGVSFEDLGAAIARHWNLPDILQNSLSPDSIEISPREVISNSMAWLRLCPLSCRRITESMFRLPEAREKIELAKCIDFFQISLKLNEKKVLLWIEKCILETDAILASMAFPSNVEDARKLLRKASERATDILLERDSLVKKAKGEAPIDMIKHRMRLIHEHCGFDCTLICLPSGSSGMVAMAGVGRNAALLTTKFRSSGVTQDIFKLILERKQDTFIADVNLPSYTKIIPKWYYEFVKAKSFVMLPLVSEGVVLGIIYGDYLAQQASAPSGMIQGDMKEWRVQMIQAFKVVKEKSDAACW